MYSALACLLGMKFCQVQQKLIEKKYRTTATKTGKNDEEIETDDFSNKRKRARGRN